MNIPSFAFETFHWEDIPKEEYKGITAISSVMIAKHIGAGRMEDVFSLW